MNAQNTLVNVEKSLFEMAKDALKNRDYKRANSLLRDASDNGYYRDSIIKYNNLIEFHCFNNSKLEEALRLLSKNRFQDAKEVFDSISNDFVLDSLSLYLRNFCNERVTEIHEGRALSRELAQFMNDHKDAIKINPYVSKSFNNGYFKCKISNSTYFISKDGFAIPGMNARESFSDSIFIISDKRIGDYYYGPESLGKVSYAFDNNDNTIILPNAIKFIPCSDYKFYYISSQINGFAKVRDCGGSYGYINLQDNVIIKCIYNDGGDFSEGLIRVSNGKRWGYIDSLGNQTIDFKFKYCEDFSEGLAVAKKNSKYGYIDKKGDWVIAPKFDIAYNFKNGYAAVRIKDKWFFIDHSGENSLNQYFIEIGDNYVMKGFSEGYACVRIYFEDNGKINESKWGFIDTSGNRLTPFIYDTVKNFSDGVAVVARDGYKYGYVDNRGKEIIPPIYEEAFKFNENLGLVRLDGFYGFIDKNGVSTFDLKNNDE